MEEPKRILEIPYVVDVVGCRVDALGLALLRDDMQGLFHR